MKTYKARLHRVSTGSFFNWECKAKTVQCAVEQLGNEMPGWLFQEIVEQDEVKRKRKKEENE